MRPTVTYVLAVHSPYHRISILDLSFPKFSYAFKQVVCCGTLSEGPSFTIFLVSAAVSTKRPLSLQLQMFWHFILITELQCWSWRFHEFSYAFKQMVCCGTANGGLSFNPSASHSCCFKQVFCKPTVTDVLAFHSHYWISIFDLKFLWILVCIRASAMHWHIKCRAVFYSFFELLLLPFKHTVTG